MEDCARQPIPMRLNLCQISIEQSVHNGDRNPNTRPNKSEDGVQPLTESLMHSQRIVPFENQKCNKHRHIRNNRPKRYGRAKTVRLTQQA